MEFIRVQKINYIGNRLTNKYKNNVQLYVQPYFTDKDIIKMVDLKTKKRTENMKIHKMGVGKYTYYRFWSSQLSKHTDQYCMMVNISKAVETDVVKRSGSLDKYLLVSNDVKKEPLLLVILNAKFMEVISFE